MKRSRSVYEDGISGSRKEPTVKKGLLLLVIAAVLCMLPPAAGAFPGKDKTGGDCTKCHKLDKKDAEAIVKKIVPNGEVVDIKVSPVKGLWQIEVKAGQQHGMVFLDFSKKFVAQLIPVEYLNRQKPPQAEPQKMDFSKIPLNDAVVLGPADAKKKVVVFTDPECPFCRRLHEEMKKVVAQRKDVAFYLIMFPLEMHKDAFRKAQAILCDKSLTVLDDAFTGKEVANPKCSAEAVERTKKLGESLGVSSTPTLVREDGTVMSGSLPADKLSEWIDGK
jgi:thiol:disulfide interchange protein DsbC